MTADWLDSLPFLTEEQRGALRGHDLDSPAALAPFNAEQIAKATGLTLGKAGRLLTAATPTAAELAAFISDASLIGGRLLTAATPTAAPALPAEPDDLPARRRRALEAARADPAKTGALANLLDVVVVGTSAAPDSSEVNVEATMVMLRHADSGAPVGATWAGLRVLKVRELCMPQIFCNPRTGVALQDGKDPVSLVPWAELGIEGLRLAAYGYDLGLFEGRSEEAAQAAIRDDAVLRQRIATMAKAAKVELSSLDARLVWQSPSGDGNKSDGAAAVARFLAAHNLRQPGAPDGELGRGPWTQLRSMLLARFSGDELRRLVGYTLGHHFLAELPGPTASLAALADSVVELLRRHNRADATLRDAMIRARPRSAAEIVDIFAAFDVR